MARPILAKNLNKYLNTEINKYVNTNYKFLNDKEKVKIKAIFSSRYSNNKRRGIDTLRRVGSKPMSDRQFINFTLGRKRITKKSVDIDIKSFYSKGSNRAIRSFINDYSDYYHTEEGNQLINEYNAVKQEEKVDQTLINEARQNLLDSYNRFTKAKAKAESINLAKMALNSL